jgi:Fur family transcriptional regulator, ferric uptake regulator
LLTGDSSADTPADEARRRSGRLNQHRNYHVRVSRQQDERRTPSGGAGTPAVPSKAALAALHLEVSSRLGDVEQRYTPARRALVEALSRASRPVTIPELVAMRPDVPQSSAYRNVTALIDVGVVRRVASTDDHGRFELTEDLSSHHHHFACSVCGKVEDLQPSPRLEQALSEASRVASEEQGVEVTEHRFDFVGRCADCRAARSAVDP